METGPGSRQTERQGEGRRLPPPAPPGPLPTGALDDPDAGDTIINLSFELRGPRLLAFLHPAHVSEADLQRDPRRFCSPDLQRLLGPIFDPPGGKGVEPLPGPPPKASTAPSRPIKGTSPVRDPLMGEGGGVGCSESRERGGSGAGRVVGPGARSPPDPRLCPPPPGKDYENAVKFYSQAIELNPDNAIYYGNRSLAYLRTECYGYALADATRALELDKKYVKGYYRRAASNMALGKFKAALRDYETVVKVKPNDKDAKLKYQECNKIVKQKAFERAIASDEHKRSVVDSLDIESMTIEDEYSGPKLEDGKVTLAFMKELMQWYKDQKKLHRKCAYQILVQVKEVLSKLPTLVETMLKETEKVTVCGDTHGQFYDLLHIFELNGLPSETNPYVSFPGGAGPRACWSPAVLLCPAQVPRVPPSSPTGNHETDNMNQIYGFEGEVKAKYTAQMFALFSEVFEWLALAQCIHGKLQIMHGGLFSEDGVTLDDIRKIERNRQPPDSGPMCDLLWSDPQPQNGRSVSKRGVSCQFGPDVTQRFLERNRLDYVIRSHEVKPEGYEVAHDGKCITVFSAPNYCDQMGNKGSYIHLRGADLRPEFHQFTAVPHPNVKPMMYANTLLQLGMM
ncbi:serine/threonine-protein phosphatase 5-like [Alligator sinensis]|uniref:Serine/threonine-protein phosphatase 5 n=1 Tax=Alligator sinensis TaxID=38654 RepID=A0A3Q0HDP3_ALLSI|nr:serine/threonine-protein phosphatase 5-like [Alligator sinensis]